MPLSLNHATPKAILLYYILWCVQKHATLARCTGVPIKMIGNTTYLQKGCMFFLWLEGTDKYKPSLSDMKD